MDRNGNYEDKEPYCDKESIGVGFAEEAFLVSELNEMVKQLTNQPAVVNVVRWFDSPDQLEIIEKDSVKKQQE